MSVVFGRKVVSKFFNINYDSYLIPNCACLPVTPGILDVYSCNLPFDFTL